MKVETFIPIMHDKCYTLITSCCNRMKEWWVIEIFINTKTKFPYCYIPTREGEELLITHCPFCGERIEINER